MPYHNHGRCLRGAPLRAFPRFIPFALYRTFRSPVSILRFLFKSPAKASPSTLVNPTILFRPDSPPSSILLPHPPLRVSASRRFNCFFPSRTPKIKANQAESTSIKVNQGGKNIVFRSPVSNRRPAASFPLRLSFSVRFPPRLCVSAVRFRIRLPFRPGLRWPHNFPTLDR